MAGGPSTPELAAAVSGVGGLGFLACGYRSTDQLRVDIARVRELTSAPFGANLFSAAEAAVDHPALERYRRRLEPAAQSLGVQLGEARFDDDEQEAKLELLCAERVPIISFTFGCPSAELIQQLHARQIAAWVTVTEPEEAFLAVRRGADALVVQGVEAGGHRGSFEDRDGHGEFGLLALLRLVERMSEVPLVASGGIIDGAGVGAVLAAGARAAQIGTGFLLCPEAGTSAPHREVLGTPARTALTRTFSGRRARGIVNAFMREHEAAAPKAYPHVHRLTAPLRAAARRAGHGEMINLWAGQGHALAIKRPAAELVQEWSAQARSALERARCRLPSGEPPTLPGEPSP
jgi:nitronate monooxygenase